MPRYHITQETRNGAEAWILTDTDRRAEAVLYPQYGNNCTEFRTTPDNDSTTETVDIFVPPAHLEDFANSPFHAGQPLLFPFPNRVREGKFTFEGEDYNMAGLLAKGWDRGAGQAIHGLVADKAWTVEETRADDAGAYIRCSLQLDAFSDIAEQYPFPCRLTIAYILAEGVLTMHTELKNNGTKNQPFGFGIHPWFPTALRPGVRLKGNPDDIPMTQRATAQVHVPASGLWELEKLMPTGKVLSFEETEDRFDLREFRPLEGHFYDHVFTGVQHSANGWSEGGLRDPESGLEMYVAADGAFREWVLYAPETRPVIALEPYTCATDAVNLNAQGIDAGLLSLAPGATWSGDIKFGLRRFA
jgi:aldose 1-epimerase